MSERLHRREDEIGRRLLDESLLRGEHRQAVRPSKPARANRSISASGGVGRAGKMRM